VFLRCLFCWRLFFILCLCVWFFCFMGDCFFLVRVVFCFFLCSFCFCFVCFFFFCCPFFSSRGFFFSFGVFFFWVCFLWPCGSTILSNFRAPLLSILSCCGEPGQGLKPALIFHPLRFSALRRAFRSF